jgi:mono/diheme cytochrome c family protein
MKLTTRRMFPAALALALGVITPAVAAAQDVKRGQEVYAAQKCSVCHSIAGAGSKMNPLDGLGAKMSADDIRKWIVNPAEMTKQSKSTKKPPMPAKYDKLPAADLDAMVAYLHSLK